MDRFAIGEKHHSQVAILGLRHEDPAADAPVGLCHFFDGRANGSFDPFVADDCTVRPIPQRVKVQSGLHEAIVAPMLVVAA